MADDPIYLLTNEPNPDENVIIPIDRADFTDAMGTTKAQLFAVDRANVAAADAAIEDGAGLNAGGTLSPEPTSTYLKNADFLAAAYNVDLRNGLLLLDAAIASVASSDETEYQINLSSAEILALAAPLTKIPNPGAGLQFHWFECDATIFFNTTPYVCFAGNGIDVIFLGATDMIVRLPKTFVEEAAATRNYKFLIASHELFTNTAIQCHAPDGNPIKGDSNISIRLRGRIQPELAYGATLNPISNCCTQPLFDDFVNADLDGAGNLVITHNQNTQNLQHSVRDNTGAWVATTFTVGDALGADPNNKITIPIGLGIVGTWKWFLLFA